MDDVLVAEGMVIVDVRPGLVGTLSAEEAQQLGEKLLGAAAEALATRAEQGLSPGGPIRLGSIFEA